MEKHSVSKLIGSPPGYVGYDEAGQLTEKIRRKPYSVILFDEIEKAHPDVMNILLQILDDGRITDAQGRVVNFENTVIIMTSNAGSDRKDGSVGFGRTLSEQSREKAMKALGEFLRPEFLNRVDDVICFNKLTEENFRGIAAIMLRELQDSLAERGTTFRWEPSLVDALVQKSYSVTYGARNLRRTIQRELEDPHRGENHRQLRASHFLPHRVCGGRQNSDPRGVSTQRLLTKQNIRLKPPAGAMLRRVVFVCVFRCPVLPAAAR